MASRIGKRIFDLAVSIPLLAISIPIQAIVAALVKVNLGSPVLFRQVRPGHQEEPFELIKFRTMLPIDHKKGLVEDNERLTRFGSMLRSTSLDELPTLWNVVRGDMSLVGPRPLLPQYLSLYSPVQSRRHLVRPGVTGLAQVSGRNALPWDQKLKLDVDYVDQQSFILDMRILLLTIAAVILRRGVNAVGQVTTTEFTGAPLTSTNSA